VPDWAKNRPTRSEPRFLLDVWIPPLVVPAALTPTSSVIPATSAPAAKTSSRKAKPKSRPAVARKPSKSSYVRIQTYKGNHYVRPI